MTAPRSQFGAVRTARWWAGLVAAVALLAPASVAVAQAPFDVRVNFSSPNAPIPSGTGRSAR